MSSGYKPGTNNGESPSRNDVTTDVYAVHGADPEVQAYGMAKYSRSALSMRESLAEINNQKAEKFLNTFYFQYGHRSIADLAHVAFAIERLSILAATVAVDEPRWDGQERSTRYQDFQSSGYYVPDFGDDAAARSLYRETIDHLFSEYRHFSAQMFDYLRDRTPQPAEMKQEAYERTLRARAFDLSRYFLPLAANTSLGQIVSARTLENQVSRLLSHTHAEVRRLGELLRKAAQEPAYNVSHARRKLRELLEAHLQRFEAAARDCRSAPSATSCCAGARGSHADEVRRAERVRDRDSARFDSAAAELLAALPSQTRRRWTCWTTIRWRSSWRQRCCISTRIIPIARFATSCSTLPESRRREIIDLGLRHRGRHDEVARAFLRRPAVPLRHPDGHRRLPRHASPSPLRADHAGLHHRARLRDAA